MKTGFSGAYVISWSQTETDGLEGAPVATIAVGSTWSWQGETVRVDGPANSLQLSQTEEMTTLRQRAARMVHRLVGAALENVPAAQLSDFSDDATPLFDTYFQVTDGAQTYTISVIPVGSGRAPLVMFLNEIPPRSVDLWVVHHALNLSGKDRVQDEKGGVICFTPGTWIETPSGQRKIEDLREGDRLTTRDCGEQDVLWIGQRKMSGARLYAMPHLRPVRIRTGAFGADCPDSELVVSPEHRMLITGQRAKDLFNETEVLASAKDLVDNRKIVVDWQMQEVTYVHLLLRSHQIIIANGMHTESFHPANAALSSLRANDYQRLLNVIPEIASDPHNYGAYARRNLTTSETAILRHVA
ncbi:MAG: Hint domain-containing protein [Paracoccaceae bacterium]